MRTRPPFIVFAALFAARVAHAQDLVPAAEAAATTDEADKILREVEAEADTTAADAAVDSKLLVYGFLDAGAQRYFRADRQTQGLLATQSSTFVSGNTNLYFDARPVRGWRGLIETRLSLLPQGDYDISRLGAVPRTDTRKVDATSPSGRNNVQLGSVIVERSQIEYTHNDAVNLRVGYFFTPWGIWNVDHGTPTLISLMMPAFLVQEAVPQRQTGVEFYGSWNGPPWQIGYHLYISNGRTRTLFDLSDDKAVGGRLLVSRQGRVRFALGFSGLYGTSSDESKSITLDPDGYPVINAKKLYSFTEKTVGADLSLDAGGFRLRAEVVHRQQIYDKGFHEPSTLRPGGVLPNFAGNFAYIIGAYRFARHYEPYVYAEWGDGGLRNNIIDSGSVFSVGLNIYFTPYTQLKTQYVESVFSNFSGNNHHLGFWSARLVLAF